MPSIIITHDPEILIDEDRDPHVSEDGEGRWLEGLSWSEVQPIYNQPVFYGLE